MAFGISEDDIIAAALRRGLTLDDDQASKWFDQINHDAVEWAALQAVEMEDQATLALDAIESQLDELGCFDQIKAEQAAGDLSEHTPRVSTTRAKRI